MDLRSTRDKVCVLPVRYVPFPANLFGQLNFLVAVEKLLLNKWFPNGKENIVAVVHGNTGVHRVGIKELLDPRILHVLTSF